MFVVRIAKCLNELIEVCKVFVVRIVCLNELIGVRCLL